MDHPQQPKFEAFAIGALTDEESAAFVEHVSTCDDCAKKLEAEARAELAILEVHAASKLDAPRVRGVRGVRAPKVTVWRAAGALALAAALLLFVLSRRGAQPTATTMTVSVSAPSIAASAGAPGSQPIPLVVCPDSLDQEKCVEDAHRHGLFVSYPPWASAPPLGGGRSGQGPTGSPFSTRQM